MSFLSVVDVTNVKSKTQQDVSLCQIRNLCERKDNKQVEIKFFELPLAIKDVLSTLAKVHESSTFQDLWIKYGKKAQTARKNDEAQKRHLSISDVVEFVWTPAAKEWNQHVASLVDGTITLGDVDKLFDSYKNRKRELEEEFLRIFRQTVPNANERQLKTRVGERVAQIQRYQELHQYASAADTIWEFKEAMLFTGDFKVIADLRNQVLSLLIFAIGTLEFQKVLRYTLGKVCVESSGPYHQCLFRFL